MLMQVNMCNFIDIILKMKQERVRGKRLPCLQTDQFYYTDYKAVFAKKKQKDQYDSFQPMEYRTGNHGRRGSTRESSRGFGNFSRFSFGHLGFVSNIRPSSTEN